MFTTLCVFSIIGIAVLGSGNNTSSVQVKHTCTDKYSKEWFRDNLSSRHYSNWDCQTIAYTIKDNWIKDDFERLLRNGYSVEYAVDELVSKNIIKL